MKPNLLIAGYFGFGNTGDEAILQGMLRDLRGFNENLRITVVSADPDQTRDLYGVEAVMFTDIPAIVSVAEETDAIVVGGGGLYHDYWPVRDGDVLSPWHGGIAYLDGFALLAQIHRKPFILHAVGVGPLNTPLGKSHTRDAFELAQLATVRDAESLQLLRTIGVRRRVGVSADPAFRIPIPEPDEINTFLKKNKCDPGEPLIGVSLRYWDFGVKQAVWEKEVARSLDRFIDPMDGRIAFMPFQQEAISEYEDDWNVCKRVLEMMESADRALILDIPARPDIAAGVISRFQLILAMRLHAIIFALKAGVPVVGMAYDPKVAIQMENANLERYIIPPAKWTEKTITDRLLQSWRERDDIAPITRSYVAQMETRVKKNTQQMLEVAKKGSILQLSRSFNVVRDFALAQSERTIMWREDSLTKDRRLDELAEEVVSWKSNTTKAQTELEDVKQEIAVLDGQLAEIKSQFTDHAKQAKLIKSHARTVEAQKKEIESVRRQLEEKEKALQFSLEELNAIKQGVGWVLLTIMWRVRLLLAPQGSRREKVLLGIVRGSPFRKGWERIRRALFPEPMSWYSYAFDRFKRERNRIVKLKNLRSIHWPSQIGLVTVVLPAYNGAGFIHEAVESLLNQTYTNWELIAINDGSTDETGDILEEFARLDSRITVLHQENMKIPATLSRGFRLARGEFLTWFSCDNRFKPEFLQRMVDCLQRHPHWDMTYANIDIIGDEGGPLLGSDWYRDYQVPPGSDHIHLPQDPNLLNIWPNNYVGSAFLYRKRVVDLIGNYNELRYTVEDYDYWMRVNALLMLRHTDFPDPVYDYRFHTTSLTSQDDDLGITRYRPRLMAFDDFRRDFYLTPMLWAIAKEGSTIGGVSTELARCVRNAGQYCTSVADVQALEEPGLWLPSLYIRITEASNNSDSPPPNLPSTTYKTLVLKEPGTGDLVSLQHGSWDLILFLVDKEGGATIVPDIPNVACVRDARAIYSVLDIKARTAHLQKIEHALDNVGLSSHKITVVICTYRRRGEELIPSVISVAQQTLAKEKYEILIVNNDPEDASILSIVDDLRQTYFDGDVQRLRLIHCPIEGLSHARNAGIGSARGEIVCFIDDDALADERWLETTAAAFDEHPDLGVVGGQIILKTPEPKPGWIKDGWEGYWSGLTPSYQKFTQVEHWWELPWGANWSARRNVLLEIGGFRTRYGRKGNGFAGGEEIIAARTVQQLGYRIGFEPASKVIHDVDTSRFTRRHVWNTILSGRRTLYDAQRDLYLPMTIDLKRSLSKAFQSLRKLFRVSGSQSFFIKLAELNADLNEVSWTIQDRSRRIRRPITQRRT